MKKTIASILQKDGTWTEQYDIEMHPLEERQYKAYQAIHDVETKIPAKPTQEEEHNWLVENGPEFVKLKRDEWKKTFDSFQPELQRAKDYYVQCTNDWHAHIDNCITKSLDPDKN